MFFSSLRAGITTPTFKRPAIELRALSKADMALETTMFHFSMHKTRSQKPKTDTKASFPHLDAGFILLSRKRMILTATLLQKELPNYDVSMLNREFKHP
jgi:hypothetical protein